MQNTKRQRQIKAFLLEEFGTDRGNALFDKREKVLDCWPGDSETSPQSR